MTALYFAPHVGSFKSLLQLSTSVCVAGASAEQFVVAPTVGQLPDASDEAPLLELLQAATPTNKTAPTTNANVFMKASDPQSKGAKRKSETKKNAADTEVDRAFFRLFKAYF